MELSSVLLFENITALPEEQPQKASDYKLMIGIISGNKHFIKKSSLEEIVYLIDNLTDIMQSEASADYPSVDLKKFKAFGYVRRVI